MFKKNQLIYVNKRKALYKDTVGSRKEYHFIKFVDNNDILVVHTDNIKRYNDPVNKPGRLANGVLKHV